MQFPSVRQPQDVLDLIAVVGPWPVSFRWHPAGIVTMIVTRPDTFTGEKATVTLTSRPLTLSAAGTSDESSLVRTAFGLYKSFTEHEAREAFAYNGRRVFGPHISVEALWGAARHLEG